MSSLSDLLLQQSMRNQNGGAATTLLILTSMLIQSAAKAWGERSRGYARLAADLEGWETVSRNNPYVPVSDALISGPKPLRPLMHLVPFTHVRQARAAGRKDNPLAGWRFGNRFRRVKRLLRKEGISYKVSQGWFEGFICVQQSDLERAREVLAAAGVMLPTLMADTPVNIDPSKLGLADADADVLETILKARGFDALSREGEVIVTFDPGHDPTLLSSVLMEISSRGVAAAPEAGKGDGHARRPVTEPQRKLLKDIEGRDGVAEELKKELRGLSTQDEVTAFLNAHAEELQVEKIDAPPAPPAAEEDAPGEDPER